MPEPLDRASPVTKRARDDVAATPAPAIPAAEAEAIESLTAPRPKVRLIFLDVDGTLTDGVIGFDQGGDSRHFWIRDGLALVWARDLGVLPVVISGRGSEAVVGRMKDLGLEHYLGVADKVSVAERVREREGARWEECVMVGDDLPDVALMKRAGWPIAVADAQPELKAFAKTVLDAPGGRGAVREMVEMVLRHNGLWDQVLRRYEAL